MLAEVDGRLLAAMLMQQQGENLQHDKSRRSWRLQNFEKHHTKTLTLRVSRRCNLRGSTVPTVLAFSISQ